MDDASVEEVLTETDLADRDLVNLTTGTPAQARARAEWARERGARYVAGGIMAVPPMIGVPGAGGYVFYSGSRELFERHQQSLVVPAGTTYVGEDAGFAALHDVAALLSAMYGMFAGAAHVFALIRKEDIDPASLAMQVAGTPTFRSTGEQQGVSPELLSPYFELMRRRLAEGSGEEDLTGVIDLLVR